MEKHKEKTQNQCNRCRPLGDPPAEELKVEGGIDLDQMNRVFPGQIQDQGTEQGLGQPHKKVQDPECFSLFALLEIFQQYLHIEMLVASGQQPCRNKNQIEEQDRGALLKPTNIDKEYVSEDHHDAKLDRNEGQDKYAGPVHQFCGPR